MHLREAGFKYLLILVCLGALSLSPRLAVWLGIAAAVSWSLGCVVGGDAARNDHRPRTAARPLLCRAACPSNFNPHYVDLVEQIDACRRHPDRRRYHRDGGFAGPPTGRRLHQGGARPLQPRAALLAERRRRTRQRREPFGPVRRRMSPSCSPISSASPTSPRSIAGQVFQLLHEFHRRMEQVVFERRGTVDNYIGDCIMATFGVPQPGRTMDAPARARDEGRSSPGICSAEAGLSPWTSASAANTGRWSSVRSAANVLSVAAVGDTFNVASRMQLCAGSSTPISAPALR